MAVLPALEAPGGPREIQIKKSLLNILFIVECGEALCVHAKESETTLR